MMNWLDVVMNPKVVSEIFGRYPSLTGVSIAGICLDEDGPELALRLDLRDFPESPPTKWKQQKFNRAQLKIVLFPVVEFQMAGWATDNIVDVVLEKTDGFLVLAATGKNVSLTSKCRFIRIDSITGYQVDDSSGEIQP